LVINITYPWRALLGDIVSFPRLDEYYLSLTCMLAGRLLDWKLDMDSHLPGSLLLWLPDKIL
jgi:hypothetical protein